MAKILVVEDEMLIGMDMARMLEEAGHEVIGPQGNERGAMAALDEEMPDAAFLDVNLGSGGDSLAIARRLLDANVPFAFLSGYATSGHGIASEFEEVQRLSKPCSPAQLSTAADQLLAR